MATAGSVTTTRIKAMCKKTQMCRFFAKDACARGMDCHFAHGVEELMPAPDFRRTKICRQLRMTGRCMDDRCKFAHTKEELRRAGTASAVSASATNATNGGGDAAFQMQALQAQRRACITVDDHTGNPLPQTPTGSDIDPDAGVVGFALARGQDVSPCGSVDSDGTEEGGTGNFPPVYSAQMPVFTVQANDPNWGSGPAPNALPRTAWASWPMAAGGRDSEVFSVGVNGRRQETDEEDDDYEGRMLFSKSDAPVLKASEVAFSRQVSAPAESGKTGIRDFVSHWKDETMNLLQVKNTFLTFECSDLPRNSLRRVRSLPGIAVTFDMSPQELPAPSPRLPQAAASGSLAASRYMTS